MLILILKNFFLAWCFCSARNSFQIQRWLSFRLQVKKAIYIEKKFDFSLFCFFKAGHQITQITMVVLVNILPLKIVSKSIQTV